MLTNEQVLAELSARTARGAAPRYVRPYPDVPLTWEPTFVGPRKPFTPAAGFDPRDNQPGRTYWGD